MHDSRQVAVVGGFDDLRSVQIRFLQEAARLGEVHVLLWSDEMLQALTGRPPKLPLAERQYFLDAVRYVARVHPLVDRMDPDALLSVPGWRPDLWVDGACRGNERRREFCRRGGLDYHVLDAAQMGGFPETSPEVIAGPPREKVVVTGCYDWFHSGHVRFFEEVSACGDLYVIVGHDANIRLLKGEGHPLFPQEERRYLVGSIRYVRQALVSTGHGWLDAEPEILRIRPQIYAVNEDGDQGGKREFCAQHGIRYLVLQRTPADGLPWRSSTDLRGF